MRSSVANKLSICIYTMYVPTYKSRNPHDRNQIMCVTKKNKVT